MNFKRKILLFLLFLLLTTPVKASDECYIFIEKAGSQNSEILLTMAVTLITKYVTPVEPIPNEGISSAQCSLAVNVVENETGVFLSLRGKKINFFGKSNKRDSSGITEALIKGIYQFTADKSKKRALCKDYYNLLTKQCSENSEGGSPVFKTQQEGYLPSPSNTAGDLRPRSNTSSNKTVKKLNQYSIPNDTRKQRGFLKKGWKNLQSGNLTKARLWFTRALENNSSDGRAYFGIARVLKAEGNWEKSKEMFKKACNKDFKPACGSIKNVNQRLSNRSSDDQKKETRKYKVPNDTKKQRGLLKRGWNSLRSGTLKRPKNCLGRP